MLRAVLDANVYVGAYIRPEGPPGRIIDRCLRDAACEIVLSAEIVEEALRVIRICWTSASTKAFAL